MHYNLITILFYSLRPYVACFGHPSSFIPYVIFFWHECSSWVETKLHPEFGWVWLCRSWEKVGVGGFGGVVYHRKIRPTQLWVELSWVVAICYRLACQGDISRKIQPTLFYDYSLISWIPVLASLSRLMPWSCFLAALWVL